MHVPWREMPFEGRKSLVQQLGRMEGELMTMLDALIDPYFDHAEA